MGFPIEGNFVLESKAKISLSFKPLEPPAEVQELVELRKENCSWCSGGKNGFKCLMCGRCMCSSCFREDQRRHGCWSLYLELNYMRLQGQGRWSGCKDIYFNELQMSVYEGADPEREKLFLDRGRMEEMVEGLLG